MKVFATAGDTVIQGVLWKERLIQIVQAGNMGFFYSGSQIGQSLCLITLVDVTGWRYCVSHSESTKTARNWLPCCY